MLLVKNLTSYMIKMGESESEELDLSSKVLPVCFDADAGGGRFVLLCSDIFLELDKCLKTDENVEIGFETSSWSC